MKQRKKKKRKKKEMLLLSLLNKHLLPCPNGPSSNVEESESSSSSSSNRSTSPSPFRRFLRRLGSLIMPCSPSSPCSRIRSWLRDYDRIQAVAVVLIYIQVRGSGVPSISGFLGFSHLQLLPLPFQLSRAFFLRFSSPNYVFDCMFSCQCQNHFRKLGLFRIQNVFPFSIFLNSSFYFYRQKQRMDFSSV